MFVALRMCIWNEHPAYGRLQRCKTEWTSMPSLVHLSPKGWISADLFAEWFQHFIKCIPSQRPVVLFMDSHASHISPKILSEASENGIHLVTFSSHTTHLLQLLDVGVYKPLNKGWRKEVEKIWLNILEQSLAIMTLMDYWLVLIMAPSSQQQRVTALQKLACSLLIGILLQMKQLLHLLSLRARIQMTVGLEWLQEIINKNPKMPSRMCFSCLWAKHDLGWPGTILLKWYFHRLGKQNNPHVHIHHKGN